MEGKRKRTGGVGEKHHLSAKGDEPREGNWTQDV